MDYSKVLLEVKESFKKHFGGPLPDQVLNYWLNTKIRELEKGWLERRFCTMLVTDLKGVAAACLMAPQASMEELNAYMGIPDGIDLPAPTNSSEDQKYAAAVEVMQLKREVKHKAKPGRPKKKGIHLVPVSKPDDK